MTTAVAWSDRARTITRIVFVLSGMIALLALPVASLVPGLHQSVIMAMLGMALPCLAFSGVYLFLTRGERIEGWRLLALIAFTAVAVSLTILVWILVTLELSGID